MTSGKAARADTNARLEAAVTDIRDEIRLGRESADRQLAEIRRFIFELYDDDDDDDDDDDSDGIGGDDTHG